LVHVGRTLCDPSSQLLEIGVAWLQSLTFHCAIDDGKGAKPSRRFGTSPLLRAEQFRYLTNLLGEQRDRVEWGNSGNR
jgi:hypothetical protein